MKTSNLKQINKKTLLAFILIALISIKCAETEKPTKNPNVILIMCDDLGWGDVGFNGNEIIKTPNLDRLAKSGIILNRFYSASAVCSPTRASCLTGRNPNRMKIFTANSGHMLAKEITLPELLKEQNYNTGHFGKWHLGTLTTLVKDANRGKPGDSSNYSLPVHNGYDEYFCTESKVPTWDPMKVPEVFDTASGESRRYGWTPVEEEGSERSFKEYGTYYWTGVETAVSNDYLEGSNPKLIIDKATDFIGRAVDKGNNFFSTIWFHTPHLPLVVGKEYREQYKEYSHKEQLLFGAITSMDEQVGKLLDFLESKGERENTMIWFCSDNGPENGTPGVSGPFRERKRSLHEGGVRVPGIFSWPANFEGNQVNESPIVTSDYILTILDFLDVSYPDSDRPLDGISAREILEKKGGDRKKPIGFKLHNNISWMTDQYKLISKNDGKTFELYDLISDKGEQLNISKTHPEDSTLFHNQLTQWLKSVESSIEGADY
jgi:arylsulfatase A-like enzyme